MVGSLTDRIFSELVDPQPCGCDGKERRQLQRHDEKKVEFVHAIDLSRSSHAVERLSRVSLANQLRQ